ncbi:Putative glycosyltransferase EpsH [Corynebacterium atrinae]|uniref:glycosyltransferase family 2 protein n=1 Tax=Corynebacterium atrinae TaxID=1336740 RepID=UPI0025B3A9B7|nr:glycosyltransferase family 2 protein [Corynebacterium atrinae]WJY64115.1 Putative glycosyltransferase EpsH [Corynebacterium atrinae]
MSDAPVSAGRPALSVIIPCLNDARLLDRCLRNLGAQSVAPAEVIVVDNGSTDDSADVARRHGALVVDEPRRGITWATKAGFDAAGGDVLMRIDADVELDPDYLERVRDIWRRAEASPGRRVVGVTGSARFEIPGPAGDIASSLYLGAYFRSVGSTLGHYPLFGTNYSIRADWWAEVRDSVDLSDTYVHEDMQLSFAVRADETVWFQKDLVVSMDDRALHGIRQVAVRFHRGFYTVLRNWRKHPPHRRLAQRGLLGTRLREVLAP